MVCFTQHWYSLAYPPLFLIVRSRFGSRAKFEMVEVQDAPVASKPTASSFPATAPTVTSAVTKAQRKNLSKKNK